MRHPTDPERWLFFAVIALALFPVWGVYYSPGLDLPEHVLAMQVVARRGYDAGPDYHGQLFLNSAWAPYSLLYMMAAPLVRITNALLALKLLMSLSWVATALALRRLLRLLQRDRFAFYFAFPFLFSTAYLAGFFSYLLGIPLVLLLAGMVLREPRTTPGNFLPRLAILFLLVLAHPMLYAGAAAMLAAMLLPPLFRRSIRVTNSLASLLWLAMPALYLAAWTPLLSASTELTWQYKWADAKLFLFNVGAYELRAFDQPFWLPKLPLLAWLAVVAFEWLKKLRSPANSRQAPASSLRSPASSLASGVFALLLLAVALPERFSGQMVTAPFRFAPLVALLAAPLLPAFSTRSRVTRALLASWCIAVLAANCLLAWRFDRQMDGFVGLARQMEPRQAAVLLYEGPENTLFHHVLSYYNAEKGGLNPQSFLVKPEVQHFPAKLLPPFPWGNADWENRGGNPLVDPAGRAFRYIIAKTSRAGEAGPPPYHRLRARQGGWLLFERKATEARP